MTRARRAARSSLSSLARGGRDGREQRRDDQRRDREHAESSYALRAPACPIGSNLQSAICNLQFHAQIPPSSRGSCDCRDRAPA